MIRAGVALGALAGALVAFPSSAFAQSEERLSADVSATAGYSNNPFSIVGDDTGSALLALTVSPRFQILTQRSTVSISGNANVQQYLRRYGSNDSYSGAVDYQLRPSQNTTAHARLDLESAVLGSFGGYQPAPSFVGTGITTGGSTTGTGTTTGTTPIVPATTAPPLVPISDLGLYGLRNRRRLARLSGDVSFGLSERDTLIVSGYGEATRYNMLPQFGNYEAYSGSLNWTRRLNDRFTAGIRASASSYNYRTANGDTRAFPIEATLSGRLSAVWSIDGALGATFIDSSAIGSTRKTSLSGNVNLCRRGELSQLCVQAARQASPTGFAGTQYATTAGATWTRRLSERENLTLNGSYSKVSSDNARLLIPGSLPLQTEFAQAVVSYDRQVSERVRFVASANYRQLLGGNVNRPADFGGQVGLSYRIGDRR